MDARPLTETIGAILEEVGRLAERDRSRQSQVAAQARLAFVQGQVEALRVALDELRAAAGDRPERRAIWAQTCAALRASRPPALASPAAALVAGDLDLLRLVEYTAGSVALIRERLLALQAAQEG